MKKILVLLLMLTFGTSTLLVYKFRTMVYKGTLPCADCPGIDVTLVIHGKGTYEQTYVYRERKSTFEEKGLWDQRKGIPGDPNALYYELISAAGKSKTYYVISGKQLHLLDSDRNPIPGPYSGPLTR